MPADILQVNMGKLVQTVHDWFAVRFRTLSVVAKFGSIPIIALYSNYNFMKGQTDED
jgi:hypothetical protein